jgi:5-formyltetrahydrofolate cyclo-ligase
MLESPDIVPMKQAIRAQVLQQRGSMDTAARMAASHAVVALIARSNAFTKAECFCSFCPTGDEVQVGALAAAAIAQGGQVLLPAYDNSARCYRFRRWTPGLDLVPGRWNILEPAGDGFVVPSGSVCMLVPGLAFDRAGGRIGYGAGYYDRMIHETRSQAGVSLTAIGVAFPFQLHTLLPQERYDERMDVVVAGDKWIICPEEGQSLRMVSES